MICVHIFCIYLVFYEVKHSILTQENTGTVQIKIYHRSGVTWFMLW